MQTTPKSLRLQIGLFGRTNVGKSSFLNLIAGQDVSITSPVPGTTTDVVEKTMELLPIGPVVFLDTAGLDDSTVLGPQRVERTRKALGRCDVAVLLTEPGMWGDLESAFMADLKAAKKPGLIVVNKADQAGSETEIFGALAQWGDLVIACSSVDSVRRDEVVHAFKRKLMTLCPEDFLRPPALVGDLVPAGATVILIIPIDFEAPKGRLIMPQVQTIRDLLDHDSAALIVKEDGLLPVLSNLKQPPGLIVCDSQVVKKMVAETPVNVACTTFSILFARLKGDLVELARGAAAIEGLRPGDRVLVAESCTHHAVEDDIGRVKIPRWFREYVGGDLRIDQYAGRDYPRDLAKYKLVIHCGSCMLTRGETLLRIDQARQAGVPVTNYGLAISYVQGVLGRVLEPFPEAKKAFESELLKNNRTAPETAVKGKVKN